MQAPAPEEAPEGEVTVPTEAALAEAGPRHAMRMLRECEQNIFKRLAELRGVGSWKQRMQCALPHAAHFTALSWILPRMLKEHRNGSGGPSSRYREAGKSKVTVFFVDPTVGTEELRATHTRHLLRCLDTVHLLWPSVTKAVVKDLNATFEVVDQELTAHLQRKQKIDEEEVRLPFISICRAVHVKSLTHVEDGA